MRKARGTFTVWYLPVPRTNNVADDAYAHDIKAGSKAELMRLALEQCPAGKEIKSITWQNHGSTHIWFKIKNRAPSQCWDERVCRDAFGG